LGAPTCGRQPTRQVQCRNTTPAPYDMMTLLSLSATAICCQPGTRCFARLHTNVASLKASAVCIHGKVSCLCSVLCSIPLRMLRHVGLSGELLACRDLYVSSLCRRGSNAAAQCVSQCHKRTSCAMPGFWQFPVARPARAVLGPGWGHAECEGCL
jgi:hypothetical protein